MFSGSRDKGGKNSLKYFASLARFLSPFPRVMLGLMEGNRVLLILAIHFFFLDELELILKYSNIKPQMDDFQMEVKCAILICNILNLTHLHYLHILIGCNNNNNDKNFIR